MGNVIQWLQGKKTYIGAAMIALAACAAFFAGQIDGPTFTMALGVAVSIAGLSAKLNRYLPDVAIVAQDVKDKNYKAALGTVVTDAAAARGIGS